MPPLPDPIAARTLREIFRLALNDPRYGLGAVLLFVFMVLLGLDGPLLAWLWADLVDGTGATLARGQDRGRARAHVAAAVPHREVVPGVVVRQMLRISLRPVHGQTGRAGQRAIACGGGRAGWRHRAGRGVLADNLIGTKIAPA